VLYLVVPYLPGEIAFIREGEASELFDYKNTILLVAALFFMTFKFKCCGYL
jgi:hypothetical protein